MQSFALSAADILHDATRPYLSTIEAPFITLSSPFYSLITQVDSVLHLGEGSLMYMTFLLLSFPLALIHRRLPPGHTRHLFSALFGLLFCFLVFGWKTLHSFVPALVSYACMLLLPAHLASKITFVFAFSYLSLCHMHRMATDYLGWSIDFTALQMLTTLKVISVSFNVHDGRKSDRDLIPIWKKNSIDHVPDPLAYLGYLLFYPCVLTGPVYELQDYLHWTETPSTKLPSSIKTIWKNVGFSVLCMSLYVFLGPIYNRSKLLEPYISEISLLHNMINIVFIGLVMRQKYYIVWYLAEAACVTAGFGKETTNTSGKNGDDDDRWSQIEHADFITVEFATNMRGVMTGWNKAVSRWLRYYVYTRIGPVESHVKSSGNNSSSSSSTKVKRPGLKNTLVTFTISAFWHGFYPGYYIMWAMLAVAQNTATSMHRKTRPMIINDEQPSKNSSTVVFLYQIGGWVLTTLCISYYTTSFHLLSIHESVTWFNRVYWIGHIVTFALFIGLRMMRVPRGAGSKRTTAPEKKME